VSNGILSKLISEIGEANAESRSESYTMVNVRPGEKVSAMLALLAKLSGKSPSALVSDELSRRLATLATSKPAYTNAILSAVEKSLDESGRYGFQDGSALDYLKRDKIIEINDPISSQFDDMFENK